MNTLVDSPRVRRAGFRGGVIELELADGRVITFPVTVNPRLRGASPRQLANIEISPFGLHWPDLDEDLSTLGILAGRFGGRRESPAHALGQTKGQV